MILGIGNDIIDIRRIEKAIERYGERFLDRIFTAAERARSDGKAGRAASYAKRFAAKEACAKALGCGISGCPLDAVEVLRSKTGAPVITTYGKAKERMDALGVRHIWVSITHDGGMAVAVVVLEGD